MYFSNLGVKGLKWSCPPLRAFNHKAWTVLVLRITRPSNQRAWTVLDFLRITGPSNQRAWTVLFLRITRPSNQRAWTVLVLRITATHLTGVQDSIRVTVDLFVYVHGHRPHEPRQQDGQRKADDGQQAGPVKQMFRRNLKLITLGSERVKVGYYGHEFWSIGRAGVAA